MIIHVIRSHPTPDQHGTEQESSKLNESNVCLCDYMYAFIPKYPSKYNIRFIHIGSADRPTDRCIAQNLSKETNLFYICHFQNKIKPIRSPALTFSFQCVQLSNVLKLMNDKCWMTKCRELNEQIALNRKQQKQKKKQKTKLSPIVKCLQWVYDNMCSSHIAKPFRIAIN